MSAHPLRHLKDGVATTRRAHGVVRVDCANPYHIACFEPLLSWAGMAAPRQDKDWHIWLNRQGVFEVTSPMAARETSQFLTGLKQRAKRLHETEGEKE